MSMTTFANAATNTTKTTNGMTTFRTSNSALLDMFGSVSGYRNKPGTALAAFKKAFAEDPIQAYKLLFHIRDVRGGHGERDSFREVLKAEAIRDPELVSKLLEFVPEFGRWDDLLVVTADVLLLQRQAFNQIATALLQNHDALCAKWMPRRGKRAELLKKHFQLTNSQYRRMLSLLSETVEQLISANQYDQIDYGHVPSLAAVRHRKSFLKHDNARYTAYIEALTKGEAKVNAGAIAPHEVLPSRDKLLFGNVIPSEWLHVDAQFNSLPDFIPEGKNILPMVDVSGSMSQLLPGNKTGRMVIEVAVSLGLYTSLKLKGKFNKMWLNFSTKPTIRKLTSDSAVKNAQVLYRDQDWGYSTDLERAFKEILRVAIAHNVSQEEMPDMLIIFSDMQFNEATSYSDTAHQTVNKLFAAHGYSVPKVVFWNLASPLGQMPVKQHSQGVAIVSGFSPNLMKAILSNNLENFDPMQIMMEALSDERYDNLERVLKAHFN